MKILMLTGIDVDVDKARIKDVWPKYLHKNDTLNVYQIQDLGDEIVNIVLDNDDVLLSVPKNTFKTLEAHEPSRSI